MKHHEQTAPFSGLDYVTTPVGRRAILDLMAAGSLAAVLAPLGAKAAAAATDDTVRIGYLPITDATALLVAHEKGFLADEGLRSAPPTLIRGWASLVEAFVAGKFNVVHLLKPIPVWMRYNNRIPVKIAAWAHTNGSGLVVGGHTDIKSFADLGGRQIAVPFWYSMHNIVLQIGLRNAGVKAVIRPQNAALTKEECNLQVLPPPEMPLALAARKIDGYIVAEPFNALGEMRAGARMLRFTGDIWKNHPCCVVTMNERDLNDRPEWSEKVVNAIVRAQIYTSAHKREVAHLLSRDGKGYLPVPGNVVERAMTFYDAAEYGASGAIRHPGWNNGRIDFQPWPYPSATRLITRAMNETVVEGDTTFLQGLDPEFVTRDLVDYRYVRKALERNPEWTRDPSVDPTNPFSREEIVQP